jgi:hypothetical protein
LDNPYNNKPVTAIMPLLAIRSNDNITDLQGFAIVLKFDKRQILRNLEIDIVCRIQSENRIVISGLPLEDYGLLHQGVKSLQMMQRSGVLDGYEYLMDGLTNANNTYLDEETRFYEATDTITLEFPKHVQLNVSRINKVQDPPNDEDHVSKLPSLLVPVTNEYDLEVEPNMDFQLDGLNGNSNYIFWIVARTDTKDFKRNKQRQTKEKKSGFAKSMGL